jgi:hypothetical protein
VRYTGTAIDETGKPLGATVSVTFLIFKDEVGGEPLWMETQMLPVDATGQYVARLGATLQDGLPLDVFAGGEARWLEVQIAGRATKARTLLTSVPYALKAANSDFLGGKSATDFVTADQLKAALGSRLATEATAQGAVSNASTIQPETTPSGSGTANYLPVWTNSSTLGNSAIYESGNKIGIGTTSPTSDLQVNSAPGTSGATGTNADAAFKVTGGAGGNSTGSATAGGLGGAITLTAGAGGNSTGVAGANGASITIQGGAGGKGSSAGKYGNVLLNPSGGFVGIGTTSPQYPLAVAMPYPVIAANANNSLGELLVSTGSLPIASGVTDSGGRIGVRINNYTIDPGFLGTLANQYGEQVYVGDNPGAGAGTIDNSYALYLDNLTGGASTIKHSYGLYQIASTAQNYFAGNVGIGTSTPGAKLEVNGTAKFDGLATFATGQTFPGTVTGVTAGTGLIGGGNGGTVTLNLDTTKVPLLATNDNFGGAISAATLSSAGTVNAPTYSIDGAIFDSGSAYYGNAYLGFSGNSDVVGGGYNTAVGSSSLYADTYGSDNSALGAFSLYNNNGPENTAVGASAMSGNQTGGYNTALGADALYTNTIGQYNTGVGVDAGPDSASPSLQDSTALGADAIVSQSNSLVLGQTTAGSPGASYVNVGVGTATPESALDIAVTAAGALGPTLTLTNPGGNGASASIDFKTYLHSTTLHSPTGRILATDDGNYGTNLSFISKSPGGDFNGLQNNMEIYSNGRVAIPGGQPTSAQLEVTAPNGSGENAITGVGGSTSTSSYAGFGGVFYGGNSSNPSGRAGTGLYADAGAPYSGALPGDAAEFSGDVAVSGTISAAAKHFQIDDPADPANKYLVHTSVESSEMMNIYTGNVVTDKLGFATVTLPDWFQTENTDFRYQLTVIGRFAQAIVAKEVENNQFQIATNASFVKVSWQITAVRQDAYAKAHPLVPEQEKPAAERGYYIHPELYGQPEEKQIEWARRPELMRRLKTQREAAQAQSTSAGERSELPASERPPVPSFHPPAAHSIALPARHATPGKASTIPVPPVSGVR